MACIVGATEILVSLYSTELLNLSVKWSVSMSESMYHSSDPNSFMFMSGILLITEGNI